MPSRKSPYRRRLAIDDIAQHSQQIAENNGDAAFRFLDAVEATVELLCQFPEAGGPVPTSRADADAFEPSWSTGSEIMSSCILYTTKRLTLYELFEAAKNLIRSH